MPVIKINAITVAPDSGNDVADRFPSRAAALEGQDGFEGFELLKPADDRPVWLVLTRWRDEDAFRSWASSPAFAHRSEEGPPDGHLGVSSELWSYEVAGGSAGQG